MKTTNPEIDTTKFVNIDNEPFDIYINGKLVRHLETGETQTLVLYVAQVGAKHLVDKILQKSGVRDSLKDTPERRTLFVKILPEIVEEVKVNPQSDEDFKKGIFEQLQKQEELIRSFQNEDKRNEEIKALQKEIAELKARPEPKKVGRPPKLAN